MTTMPLTLRTRALARDAADVLRRFWRFNPVMTGFWLTMFGVAALGVAGLAFDSRLVGGAPVWAKTTKFALSFLAYAPSLLWIFGMVEGRPRLVRFLLNAIAGILSLEMVLILVQAVRGRPMHFNYSTPLDGALYTIMAVSISIMWALTMVGVVLLLRQRLASRPLAWGMRLGLAVSVVGMGLGYLMTSPTAAQMATMRAGGPDAGSTIGAHTVGAPDGGPGLPLLGWSTTHGDLRIPHFIGLHGLQVIPLLGWLVARRRERWLGEAHRVALVFAGAGGYLGLMALVTWQALRAQPLLRPDLLTLAGLGALLLETVLATGLILWHARRSAGWSTARLRSQEVGGAL